MDTIMKFLGNHSIWDTVILFWIFSAAVGALPEPALDSSGWYKWLYQFLTTIAGRLDDAIQQRRAARAARATQANQSKGTS